VTEKYRASLRVVFLRESCNNNHDGESSEEQDAGC